jgi:uncharacterized membrane protein YebE (DUF533 family)
MTRDPIGVNCVSYELRGSRRIRAQGRGDPVFNARDLLGQLMQTGMADSSSDRLRHAMGSEGLGRQDNPLGQLLQGLGGGGSGGGGSGGLGGLAEMAQQMFGQASGSVRSGNPLAIGGLAALAGALLGGRGGAARGAIGGGALALLGTLAMQALQKNWGQQQTPTDPNALAREAPLGLRAPQNATEEQELDQRALLMVRAMINAAKADGEIDRQEIERISAKLGDAASDQEARAFLVQEMQQPSDVDGITRQVSSPELAVQVYAASLLAIEVDTPAERAYLRDLAGRLGLDANVTSRVHQALGVPTAA